MVLGARNPVLQPGCTTRLHTPLTSRGCGQQPKTIRLGMAGTWDMQQAGFLLGIVVGPGIRTLGAGPHSNAAY